MSLIFDKPWGPDQDGYGPMKLGCRTQLSRRCWSYPWVQLHLKARIRNQRAAGGGKSHKFPGSDDLAKPHKPERRGRLEGSAGLARSLGFPLRYLHETESRASVGGLRPRGGPDPPSFLLRRKLHLSFPAAPGGGRHGTFEPLSSGLQPHTWEKGLQGPATHPGLAPGW